MLQFQLINLIFFFVFLNKEISLEKRKIITAFIKKLSSQKNIKITYKTINSDINFKDKENEIKKNIDDFINQMLVSLE